MKVLFLIEGLISPASRYRVLQFLPACDQAGIDYDVCPMHGSSYPAVYYRPRLGKLYKALVRSRRYFQRVSDYDLVFQQRLTLPFSAVVEKRLVARNPNFVFDFDDAIFQTESGGSGPEATFNQVISLARHVVAGNEYLAERAAQPTKTTIIPTIIDTDRYRPAPLSEPEQPLTIGWMGTAGNYPNFAPLLPVLERLLQAFPAWRFKIVSDRPPPFQLPNMVFEKWTAVGEIPALASFHIGLMPLKDTEWNRGKCAFKLIQYMALGLPVVASGVGSNRQVVGHGESGFLAAAPDEWEAHLVSLLEDAELRRRLGEKGRIRCVDHYSLNSQKARFINILRENARTGCYIL